MMFRGNAARAYGALCIAAATAFLASHLHFTTWQAVMLMILVGVAVLPSTASLRGQ